jgi:hypothetical protein
MDTSAILGTSPMMLAYAAAQIAAPGYLVLYRVGEFYEVLGQHAATVSRALGLHLRHRPRGRWQPSIDDLRAKRRAAASRERALQKARAAATASLREPIGPSSPLGGTRPELGVLKIEHLDRPWACLSDHPQ